jgi:hypothetical protein
VDEAIAVAERARKIAAESDKAEFAQLAPAIGQSLEQYRVMKAQGVAPHLMATPPDQIEGAAADAVEPKSAQPTGGGK